MHNATLYTRAAGVQLGLVASKRARLATDGKGKSAASHTVRALESEIETHLALAQQWLRRAAGEVPERMPDGTVGGDVALARWWAQRKLNGQMANRYERSNWSTSRALELLPAAQLQSLLRRAPKDVVPVLRAALDAQTRAPEAPADIPTLSQVLAAAKASPQPEAVALEALLKHGHHFEVGAPWVEAFAAHPTTSRNPALKTPEGWVWAWACAVDVGTVSGWRLHAQTSPHVSKDIRGLLHECIAGRARPRRVRALFAEQKDPVIRSIFARALATWGTAEQVRSLFEVEKDPFLRGILAAGTRYGPEGLSRALEKETVRDVRLALARSAILDSPMDTALIIASEPDYDVRLALVPKLAGAPPHVLREILEMQPLAKVRQAIAELLAQGGQPAFPYLILTLDDPSALTSLAAAIGLLRLEEPRRAEGAAPRPF